MGTAQRYAVVADEEAMAALLGVGRTALVGACIVDGETAECHVLDRREDLARLLSDVPTCPSGYGAGTAFPDFASESEALAMIADAAAARRHEEEALSFPPGFAPALPRMAGGLRARMTGYGIDVAVSDQLAAALGWREGGRVSLGVSSCGRMLAVSRGGQGATLARDADEPGFLGIDRDLSGVPLDVPLAETGWRWPEYQASGGTLVMAVQSLASPEVPQDARQALPEALAAKPGKAPPRLALAGAVAASAAAGFIAAALWL